MRCFHRLRLLVEPRDAPRAANASARTPSRTVPTKHARDSDADADARSWRSQLEMETGCTGGWTSPSNICPVLQKQLYGRSLFSPF